MKNNKIIVTFDTETTGLLKPNACDIKEQPYIVELFAYKFNSEGNHLDSFGTYIKPPITMPADTIRITGITDETVKDAPKFIDVFESFAQFMTGVDILSAHNLGFDRDMLANELLRANKLLNFPWPKRHICTVQSSMSYEGYRLNLTKLHTYLFGCGFEGAHGAEADVMAQTACFKEMVKRGDIKL